MNLRIAIVDDDKSTRQILAEMIEETDWLEFVGEYPDTESALAALPKVKPDVVFMDINVPALNGIECVRQLKPKLPDTEFLMLTVYADADHIFAALAAGATGYLLKSTRRAQLLTAIRQISSGGSPMSCAIARRVVQSFKPAKPNLLIEDLSPRERVVLDHLAKGFTYKEIADALTLSPLTIDSYVRRIYEKLQVNSRSQAIAKYLQR